MKQQPELEQERMVFLLFVVMIPMKILRMQEKAIKEKKKYQEKSVLRFGVYHYLYYSP